MQKMGAEDEAELIESEHRETVAPPKERKDALGDLGHNQIVFEHREAIVTYSAKTEILGNVIGVPYVGQNSARNRTHYLLNILAVNRNR